MTDKVDYSRTFRGAAWALAGACCVGVLFLGLTNCLPSAADNSSGGSGGGGDSSNGGDTGSSSSSSGGSGGTTYSSSTHASGGTTYATTSTTASTGGTTYATTSTSATGGTTYATTTSSPPSGGTTSATTSSPPPTGGTTTSSSPPPTGGSVTTCTPVPKSTGGLSCPSGKCTVGTYSGYDFTYGDGKTSSICLSGGSLCAAGVTGAQDPPAYSVYGAGLGFNLSPDTTLATTVEVQLAGAGVSVAVSSLPTGADLRIQVNVGGADYCAKMTTATQTLAWTAFNTKCWDNTGTALTGAPKTGKIEFQASSGTAAGSFDFCVTSLSFQ